MKSNFLLFFCFLVFAGCKKKSSKENFSKWTKISERISDHSTPELYELKSGKFTYSFKTSELPAKKVILLNSSLLGYFLELGKENVITGISSPEYIYSPKILQLLAEDKIENVGNEQKYEIEKILKNPPDLIFTNYIETFENTYQTLRNNGIKLIFIDDYLEQQPLEKARIITVFGKLLGAEKKSDSLYQQIEKNYLHIKKQASGAAFSPVVLTNEMYGSQWFLPGGKTATANFFKDANASYILKNNKDSKSIPLSFEEVFVKAEKAQFWMNLSNYQNKNQMLSINPSYAKMNVYKEGKLYSLYGRTNSSKGNDFFESGNVRPDLVLKDYVMIFHPKIFPNEKPFYMKEIK